MDTVQEEENQIQVRFVTQQKEFAVTDSAILVPTKLRRYGLSEIINHLLGFERPVPFDFMIDNQFLRTSLEEYLQTKELSTENILIIEYVESMLPPTSLSTFQHDDWISAVKGYNKSLFLTGSYDNHVRIFNTSGECLQTLLGHIAPIKSVEWVSVTDEHAICLSASQDRSIRAWQVSLTDGQYTPLYDCKGHKESVECISVNSSCTEFVSVSLDSSILLWTTTQPETSEEIEKKSKRRKLNKDILIKAPIATMRGHIGPISSVMFDKNDSNKMYSGGWDHSIRVWDVETRTNIDTKICDKTVLGIACSDNLIASGHSDKLVRIWDPRAEDTAMVKLTLSSHKNWVSCVSWSPKSQFMLASGSYDGTVKIWDIRSRTPLYTIQNSNSQEKNSLVKKLFCIDWDLDMILSGGEDNQLHLYGTKTLDIQS
ncbi:ribosome biogenesis protein WDR12 [Gigaspora margarita]|uniref:Ribosome biogenesis protein YTM1 n=1 Tax=Gigaspora margarita TaxID=4874 RepID=A0A8H3X7N0_GIGMA|nr:ribosome biogenesis protein WDR12 [Gigaspora margarita]